MNKRAFHSIEEALEAIRNGEIIIVCDDEDRENEGDFVMAADKVTPAAINLMATYGKGLICAPVTRQRAYELNLDRMVTENTDAMGTAFTVSIDCGGNCAASACSAVPADGPVCAPTNAQLNDKAVATLNAESFFLSTKDIPFRSISIFSDHRHSRFPALALFVLARLHLDDA